MAAETYFTVYESYWKLAQTLGSKAARDEFFGALAEYFFTGGRQPEIKRKSVAIAFESKRFAIDKSLKRSANRRKTESKSSGNQSVSCTDAIENISEREAKNDVSPDGEQVVLLQNDSKRAPVTVTDTYNKKKNIKKKSDDAETFEPPTVEEVEAYCAQSGYSVDARGFVDYYSANGWHMGRARMIDWRAAVRSWCDRAGTAPAPADAPRCPDCGTRLVSIREVEPRAHDPSKLACPKCRKVVKGRRSA